MGPSQSALLGELETYQKNAYAPTKEEVEAIVKDVLSSLSGGVSATQIAFYTELESLHDTIMKMKEEISLIRPDDIQDEHLPMAQDELSAVVRATEEATGKILDAAELIESVADMLEGAQKERLLQAATTIYEASNFQDITGQRITKVTNALRYIDEKISALMEAFAPQAVPHRTKKNQENSAPKTDNDLLNGPQLPETAASQDDIDALFNNL